MSELFNVKNITVQKSGTEILKNISFSTEIGEFISILGPSGSGKTTLINTLIGFENLSRGKISLEGKDISVPGKPHSAFDKDFAVVFQSLNLFPHLNVEENITYGLSRWSKEEKDKRFNELIKLFELESCVNCKISTLSGGEKQRVAIARSLAPRPKVLFLDEPFSSLDEQLRINLRSFLKKIFKKENINIFLITHDKEDAFYFSDRILVLNNGALEQFNTPLLLFQNPANKFVASFLGSGLVLPTPQKHSCKYYYFTDEQLYFEQLKSDVDYLYTATITEKYFYQGHYHYSCEVVFENDESFLLSFFNHENMDVSSIVGLKQLSEKLHCIED
jgi:iron(III) transport system ATP-binding protein